MTAPGPITRGRPRRINSEASAAATLKPTIPTAPIVTAAPVWVKGRDARVDHWVVVGGEPGLLRISASVHQCAPSSRLCGKCPPSSEDHQSGEIDTSLNLELNVE